MSKWNRSVKDTTTNGFDVVRDLDYQYTGKLIRNGYHGPSTRRADDWRDEGTCNTEDPSLFEYDDSESSETQWPKIHQGMQVCAGCPVRDLCYADASPANKYWTTRGGRPPEGMFEDSKAPDEPSLVQAGGLKSQVARNRKLKEKCKWGHQNWVVRDNGKRRCVDCRILGDKKRRKSDTV